MKNDLVHDVHRSDWSGVQILDSPKSGVMVHNGFESSLVMDVN